MYNTYIIACNIEKCTPVLNPEEFKIFLQCIGTQVNPEKYLKVFYKFIELVKEEEKHEVIGCINQSLLNIKYEKEYINKSLKNIKHMNGLNHTEMILLDFLSILCPNYDMYKNMIQN